MSDHTKDYSKYFQNFSDAKVIEVRGRRQNNLSNPRDVNIQINATLNP